MDKEHLSDAIGNISDANVEEAIQLNKQKNRLPKRIGVVAAAILLAVTAVIVIPKLNRKAVLPDNTTTTMREDGFSADQTEPENPTPPVTEVTSPAPTDISYALIQTEYPDGQWNPAKENELNYHAADAWQDGTAFTQTILSAFLNTEDNTVISPFSLYQSLATLAEISSGNTRAQVLQLLNVTNIEDLRDITRSMWLNVFCKLQPPGSPDESENKNIQYCIPANSLWLNSKADITGNPAIADILKNDYYTSFYRGDPLDEKYQEAYRNWLNEQTGGLLSEAVRNMKIDANDVFSMVNTLYLSAGWSPDAFWEKDNTNDLFYGVNGAEEAEFMHQTFLMAKYYKGEHFSAVNLTTKSTAAVWFILPDDSYTLNELLKNADYLELLDKRAENDSRILGDIHGFDRYLSEGYDMYEITLSLPKFSVTTSHDLKNNLINLGVTDAFDAENAEIPFIRSSDGSNICVTSAKQDVTLEINEKGVSAAALTVDGYGFGAPRFYQVDMKLDRPFLVLVTSECNTPLFAATINSIH